jgi:DNA-binding MarR family transcriptional regulator
MDNNAQHDEIFRATLALSPAELAAFVAVARCGGFRAAARRLNLSPSALSHSVANLETRLKVQLFHRSTRHVSLTEAGQRFLSPRFKRSHRPSVNLVISAPFPPARSVLMPTPPRQSRF